MAPPRQAAESAAYARDGASQSAAGSAAGPLKNRVPGYVFDIGVEDLFDAVFRAVGPGSFEEAYRRERRAELLSSASDGDWSPLPGPGAACYAASVAAAELGAPAEAGSVPRRSFVVRRQSPLPSWIRASAGAAPDDGVVCSDAWALSGLGEGRGFVIDISTQVAGVPTVGPFAFRSRYVAVALGGRGAASTQLDAEMEMVDQEASSSMVRSALEVGVLTEFRRGFEATFLPLVAKRLPAVAGSDAARSSEAALPSEFVLSQTGGSPELLAADGSSIEHEYADDWSHCSPTRASAAAAVGAIGNEAPAADDDGDGRGGGGGLVTAAEAAEEAVPRNLELRVEVLGASDLAVPEYRLGDLTSGWLSGPAAQLGAVYVELQLGSRSVRTACAANPDGARSVSFDRERLLFAYAGEGELLLSCADKRGLQSVLRGDPVVGVGALRLVPDLHDCLPRWADVPLTREEKPAGLLHLRYQFLELEGVDAVSSVPSRRTVASIVQARPPPTASVPAEHADDDSKFVTPPSSPRGGADFL
mmetsp:Transcript_163734/g.520369  ORF Transcript_163734/g.520369 Transcript_163734/m.520369 type:complete len:532 (+) Transcript_163734:85-1680(+)